MVAAAVSPLLPDLLPDKNSYPLFALITISHMRLPYRQDAEDGKGGWNQKQMRERLRWRRFLAKRNLSDATKVNLHAKNRSSTNGNHPDGEDQEEKEEEECLKNLESR